MTAIAEGLPHIELPPDGGWDVGDAIPYGKSRGNI